MEAWEYSAEREVTRYGGNPVSVIERKYSFSNAGNCKWEQRIYDKRKVVKNVHIESDGN
jgi:hypothetical protein